MSIEFKKPSIEEIESLIQKELKDIPLGSLAIQSPENFRLSPIYTSSHQEIAVPFSLDYRVVFQLFSIEISDINAWNRKIINALENGLNGIILDFQHNDWNIEDLNLLFQNIRLDYIHAEYLHLTSTTLRAIQEMLHTYPHLLNPLNSCLSENSYCISDRNFTDESAKLIQDPKITKGYIHIELCGDYFRDLAKIRAFKILLFNYKKLEQVNAHFLVIGEPTTANKSLDNIESNILKLTTEAMSGMLGGCEGLWIKPFDSKSEHEFSERISRNIFHLMQEESYLHLVQDPAHGSYFIEEYTQKFAKAIYDQLG